MPTIPRSFSFFFRDETGTYYHDAKGRNWFVPCGDRYEGICASPENKHMHCDGEALLGGVGETLIEGHSIKTWAELAQLLDFWPTHTRITWAEVDERAQAPEQKAKTRERTPVSVILEHSDPYMVTLESRAIHTPSEARRIAYLLLDAADYVEIRSEIQRHLDEMGQILGIKVPVSPRGECLKGAIEHVVKDLIRAAGWSVRASDLEAEAERRYLALRPVTCEN